MGIFEFFQMLYGLCNALATFQQLMQNCLLKLNLMYALIYLDDVIIFSRTEEEHLTQLRAVFERFREHGLKLKPSKCHFLQKEITFLGHKVSEEGMKLGDDGLKGIAPDGTPQQIILKSGGFLVRLDSSGGSSRITPGVMCSNCLPVLT